mmetsp:Transcript_65188/g.172715  ORF Transcript_65188/g.172715 Transcript_65188/m.172715 type:complete len:165 (+) Transcript_65188:1707-2201(+)
MRPPLATRVHLPPSGSECAPDLAAQCGPQGAGSGRRRFLSSETRRQRRAPGSAVKMRLKADVRSLEVQRFAVPAAAPPVSGVFDVTTSQYALLARVLQQERRVTRTLASLSCTSCIQHTAARQGWSSVAPVVCVQSVTSVRRHGRCMHVFFRPVLLAFSGSQKP